MREGASYVDCSETRLLTLLVVANQIYYSKFLFPLTVKYLLLPQVIIYTSLVVNL